MINSSRRNQVTLIELAHGKANALDIEVLGALRNTLDDLGQDPAVRALVLTGRGRMFSAGVDLHRLLEKGVDYLRDMWEEIDRCLLAAVQFPKPVVAAVNGHAIAGGCVLAQACDYRIMADGSGRIGVPELRVGVPFPRMALEVMRQALSASDFQKVVYLGCNYTVSQALQIGLLDESVPQEQLQKRAFEIAESLAAIPAASFAANKRDVRLPIVAAFRRHDDSMIRQALDDEGLFDAIREFVKQSIRSN